MTIRRMTEDDVPQVHAIEQATFANPWSEDSFMREMRENACARYLVAVEGDAILAYAGAWMIFEEGHITNVAVLQNRRGEGIGKAILQALLQYAANLGVQYLTLEVRRSNTVAQALYKSFQFIELGVRKRYYEDNGEDALLMVCQTLPPPQDDFGEDEGGGR